jgi:hypothetical protein
MNELPPPIDAINDRIAGPESGARLPLSDEGIARKHAMLTQLQGRLTSHVRRKKRTRQATQSIGACAMLLLIGTVVVLLISAPPASDRPEAALVHHDNAAAVAAAPANSSSKDIAAAGASHDSSSPIKATQHPRVRITTVTTSDIDVSRRVATATGPGVARRIDDAELLHLLGRSGDQYGLVRTSAGSYVVCNTCQAGEDVPDAPPPEVPTTPPGARETSPERQRAGSTLG